MAIISFDKDAVVDYVPSHGGNRNSEEPCVVRLKFVPYSKVQHYSRVIASRLKSTHDASKSAEVTHSVQRKQFTENVEIVSGYYVGDIEVTEPGEFYDTADTDLILEVIRAMESTQRLSEGQVKN